MGEQTQTSFEVVRENPDPGPEYAEKDAVLFNDGEYRFSLRRKWSEDDMTACVVMVNPSVADEDNPDKTVTTLARALHMLGFGEMIVVNLFPVVNSQRSVIRSHPDPQGENTDEDNDQHILEATEGSDAVFVAWGQDPDTKYSKEIEELLDLLPVTPYVLAQNKNGSPKHPGARENFYNSLNPVPYEK